MDMRLFPKSGKNKSQASNGGSSCPDDLRLATAYVPPQKYGKQFSPCDALEKGTLWPDLYSPYHGPDGNSSKLK